MVRFHVFEFQKNIRLDIVWKNMLKIHSTKSNETFAWDSNENIKGVIKAVSKQWVASLSEKRACDLQIRLYSSIKQTFCAAEWCNLANLVSRVSEQLIKKRDHHFRGCSWGPTIVKIQELLDNVHNVIHIYVHIYTNRLCFIYM